MSKPFTTGTERLDRRHLRWMIIGSVCLFGSACEAPTTGARDIQTADNLGAADDRCLVAEGSGFRLTKADAVALREFFQPPPTLAAASRLLVDMALAQAMEQGSVQGLAMAGRYRVYRAALEHAVNRMPELPPLAAIERAFDAQRRQLGLRLGPCYVTLAGPAARTDGA